jgi:hypothetical protein
MQLPSGSYVEIPEGMDPNAVYQLAQQQHPREFLTPDQLSAQQGFFPAAKSAASGFLGSTEQALGRAFNYQPLQNLGEKTQAEAGQGYMPTTQEDVDKAFNTGIMSGVGALSRKYLTEPLGEMAGRYGVPTVAGALAAAAIPEEATLGLGALGTMGLQGAVRGAVMTATDLPAEVNDNLQYQQHVNPDLPPDALKATAAGIGQAVLASFGVPGFGYLPRVAKNLFGKDLGHLSSEVVAGKMTQAEAVDELSSRSGLFLKNAAANYAGTAALGVGSEALQRAQAGQPVTDEEAQQGYKQQLAGAIMPAALFGGLHTIGARGKQIDALNQQIGIKQSAKDEADAAAKAQADQQAAQAQKEQAQSTAAQAAFNAAPAGSGFQGDMFGGPTEFKSTDDLETAFHQASQDLKQAKANAAKVKNPEDAMDALNAVRDARARVNELSGQMDAMGLNKTPIDTRVMASYKKYQALQAKADKSGNVDHQAVADQEFNNFNNLLMERQAKVDPQGAAQTVYKALQDAKTAGNTDLVSKLTDQLGELQKRFEQQPEATPAPSSGELTPEEQQRHDELLMQANQHRLQNNKLTPPRPGSPDYYAQENAFYAEKAKNEQAAAALEKQAQQIKQAGADRALTEQGGPEGMATQQADMFGYDEGRIPRAEEPEETPVETQGTAVNETPDQAAPGVEKGVQSVLGDQDEREALAKRARSKKINNLFRSIFGKADEEETLDTPFLQAGEDTQVDPNDVREQRAKATTDLRSLLQTRRNLKNLYISKDKVIRQAYNDHLIYEDLAKQSEEKAAKDKTNKEAAEIAAADRQKADAALANYNKLLTERKPNIKVEGKTSEKKPIAYRVSKTALKDFDSKILALRKRIRALKDTEDNYKRIAGSKTKPLNSALHAIRAKNAFAEAADHLQKLETAHENLNEAVDREANKKAIEIHRNGYIDSVLKAVAHHRASIDPFKPLSTREAFLIGSELHDALKGVNVEISPTIKQRLQQAISKFGEKPKYNEPVFGLARQELRREINKENANRNANHLEYIRNRIQASKHLANLEVREALEKAEAHLDRGEATPQLLRELDTITTRLRFAQDVHTHNLTHELYRLEDALRPDLGSGKRALQTEMFGESRGEMRTSAGSWQRYTNTSKYLLDRLKERITKDNFAKSIVERHAIGALEVNTSELNDWYSDWMDEADKLPNLRAEYISQAKIAREGSPQERADATKRMKELSEAIEDIHAEGREIFKIRDDVNKALEQFDSEVERVRSSLEPKTPKTEQSPEFKAALDKISTAAFAAETKRRNEIEKERKDAEAARDARSAAINRFYKETATQPRTVSMKIHYSTDELEDLRKQVNARKKVLMNSENAKDPLVKQKIKELQKQSTRFTKAIRGEIVLYKKTHEKVYPKTDEERRQEQRAKDIAAAAAHVEPKARQKRQLAFDKLRKAQQELLKVQSEHSAEITSVKNEIASDTRYKNNKEKKAALKTATADINEKYKSRLYAKNKDVKDAQAIVDDLTAKINRAIKIGNDTTKIGRHSIEDLVAYQYKLLEAQEAAKQFKENLKQTLTAQKRRKLNEAEATEKEKHENNLKIISEQLPKVNKLLDLSKVDLSTLKSLRETTPPVIEKGILKAPKIPALDKFKAEKETGSSASERLEKLKELEDADAKAKAEADAEAKRAADEREYYRLVEEERRKQAAVDEKINTARTKRGQKKLAAENADLADREESQRIEDAEREYEARQATRQFSDEDNYDYREHEGESGVDLEHADRIVRDVQSKLPNGMKFEYYARQADLPEADKAAMARAGRDSAKGFVTPDGRIVVIGEHHADVADLQKTIAHELIGHYSVEGVLGPEGINELTKRVFANGREDAFDLAADLGVYAQAKFAYDDAINRGASEEAAQAAFTKEMIAYTAENKPIKRSIADKIKGFLQGVVQAVRNALAKIGLVDAAKVTPNDIYKLISDAQRAFERNELGFHRDANGEPVFRDKEMKFNGADRDVADVIRTVVPTKNTSSFNRLKAAVSGFRTATLDRFDSLSRIMETYRKTGTPAQALMATQMMYFVRTFERGLSYASQMMANGSDMKFVKTQRPDGSYEWTVKAGTSGNSIPKVLRALGNAKIAGLNTPEEKQAFFTTYMALERAQQTGKSIDMLNFEADQKLSPEKVAKVLEQGRKDAAIQEARKAYNAYNKGLIDMLHDADVIDQATRDRLKQDDYVPYYRVDENGDYNLMLDNEKFFKVGSLQDQPHLHELVGDNRKINNAFVSSMQNTRMLVDMALRNQASKSIGFTLNSLGFADKASPGVKASNNKTLIRFKVNGEEQAFQVNSKVEDMLGIPAKHLIQGLDGVTPAMPGFVKMLRLPAIATRFVTEVNPLFAPRLLFKHSLFTWLTGGANTIPLVDAMRVLKSTHTGKLSDVGEMLRQQGITGVGSALHFGDPDVQAIMKQIMTGADKKLNVHTFTSFMESQVVKNDAAIRESLYNRFIKQGLSPMEASMAALESTNFSRRGASGSIRALTQTIPFMNALLQGLDVTYRTLAGRASFEDKVNARAKMIQRGAMLGAATLAYGAAMQSNPKYQQTSIEDRANNWLVFIPGVDEPLKLPIPFEPGLMFKALPEMVMGMAHGDLRSRDVVHALGAAVGDSMPSVIPEALSPILQTMTNYSFLSGHAIEGQRLQGLAKSERYDEDTSELAKFFGQYLGSPEIKKATGWEGISPKQIDFLVHEYLGGLGHAFTTIPNYLTGPARPTLKAHEIPLVGSEFADVSGRNWINEAMDGLSNDKQMADTFNNMIAQGDAAGAQKFAAQYQKDIAMGTSMAGFQKQLQDLGKMERVVYANPSMAPDQKRDLIDRIREARTEMAKQYALARRKLD